MRIANVVALSSAIMAGVGSGLCQGADVARSSPAGDFSAGTVLLRLDGHGHVRLQQGDKELVRGRCAVAGDTITLTDEAGPMACDPAQARGVYRWSESNGALRFVVVSDACEGRSGDLAGHAWTRSK